MNRFPLIKIGGIFLPFHLAVLLYQLYNVSKKGGHHE